MTEKTKNSLANRIQDYENRVRRLEQKLKLEPSVTIEFPQYRVLPLEVQLALKVIENHEYKFALSYKDKE